MSPLRRRRVDAEQVVAGLWVGSAPDARAIRHLAGDGITAVVDLRAERDSGEPGWPPGVEVRHVPLVDHGAPSQQVLTEAAQAVVTLMRQGREVLVHCQAGMERAPTITCAALVLSGWTMADAFTKVTTCRSSARPTEAQLDALRVFARDVDGKLNSDRGQLPRH